MFMCIACYKCSPLGKKRIELLDFHHHEIPNLWDQSLFLVPYKISLNSEDILFLQVFRNLKPFLDISEKDCFGVNPLSPCWYRLTKFWWLPIFSISLRVYFLYCISNSFPSLEIGVQRFGLLTPKTRKNVTHKKIVILFGYINVR